MSRCYKCQGPIPSPFNYCPGGTNGDACYASLDEEIKSMSPDEIRAECERFGFTEEKRDAMFSKIQNFTAPAQPQTEKEEEKQRP